MKNISRFNFSLLLFLCTLFFSGCEKNTLKEAFNGIYSIGKSNKIIYEYCESCHVHSNFAPDSHVNKMNRRYTSRLFQITNECRTCHYLEKNILGDTIRRHRRPKAVARGKYRGFIREERKRKGKRRRKSGK